MTHFICATCGIQYADTPQPPEHCLICEDDRQYVGANGQQWTTLEDLRSTHTNVLTPLQPNLTAISTKPDFAIGQNPYLVQTPQGNILWETNSLIDDATMAAIAEKGGISAIAISHPHFYDSMIEWSYAFGKVPIYLHASNREWIMRPDPVIHLWDSATFQVNDSITLIRCGGHFPGSSVLHWRDGQGVLLTGDTIYVVQDRRYVTFMYSYPNSIPMSAAQVRGIVSAIEPFEFDTLYSSWIQRVIHHDAKAAVKHSADRYIAHIAE